MSDAMLSVGVKAEMEALAIGLKEGEKNIKNFVSNSIPGLKNLEDMLSGLGVGMSKNNIAATTSALHDQRVETEKGKTALLDKKAATEAQRAATEAEKTATQQSTTAIAQNRAALVAQIAATERAKIITEAQRAAVQRAMEVNQQHTSSLINQKTATEAEKTASAALNVQINSLRLSKMQVKAATVAASGSYDEAKLRMSALSKEIKAAGGLMNGQTKEVRAQISEYNKLNDALKRVDFRMGNRQRDVANYGAGSRELSGIISSYVSIYAAISGAGKIISANADISDSLADVQRTAALTATEAENLSNNLKKIDTRTSLKGLVDIAIIGGQMGIAKDELVGFSKAVDMLAVTLSGEIKGGAEEVASALGKINGVFKVQQKEGTNVEESLNKTGSAILKLGQIGLATGQFLQDFSLRTAGVAQVANIALPTMLAYGATLEEAGISAEVAGTAVVRLMSSLSSKRNEFFAVAKLADANLTLKEFTNIVNTDAQRALTMFFTGLKAGNPTATEFSDRLDTIKIKAGPTKNAIIALAENQGKLTQRITEGTKAYNDGTLASEQFEIKNDNLASSISKLENAIVNITTNPNSSLGSFFKDGIDGATDMINGIDVLIGKLKQLKLQDAELIYDKTNGKTTGFGSGYSVEDVRKYKEEKKLAASQYLNEELAGKGISNAARILTNIKTEAELTKVLTNEKKRLNDEASRLNYNLAYIKDPNNTGAPLDAQIAKTNKLRASLATQKATVDALTSSFNKLYGKEQAKPNGTLTLPPAEDKKLNKAFESLEKQLQAFQNKSNLITKEGLAKDLQAWDDQYEKIKAVIAKLPAGVKRTKATAVLETNYTEGKNNILADNSREVADYIRKRNEAVELEELAGIARSIQNVRNEYAQKVRLAEGNKAAIIELRKQEAAEINKISTYQAARDINTSIKQLSEISKAYRIRQAEMFEATVLAKNPFAGEVVAVQQATSDLKDLFDNKLITFEAYQSKFIELTKKGDTAKAMDEYMQQVNSVATSGVNSLATSLGEGIGGLVSGTASIADVAGSLMGVVGDIATQLGQAAIKIGIGMQAIKMSFKNPFTAIAAGIALVAIGAAIKNTSNIVSGGGSGGSSGSGSSGPSYGVPHFAMGVENFGGGIALVGERGPELVNLPTGSDVIPNHKVMQSIAGGNVTQVMIPELRLSGQDLLVSFKRAEKNSNRR